MKFIKIDKMMRFINEIIGLIYFDGLFSFQCFDSNFVLCNVGAK